MLGTSTGFTRPTPKYVLAHLDTASLILAVLDPANYILKAIRLQLKNVACACVAGGGGARARDGAATARGEVGARRPPPRTAPAAALAARR